MKYLSLLIIITSCFQKKAIEENRLDSICFPIKYDKKRELNKYHGFYKKYGLNISNFYKYSDFEVFDFDNDGDNDSLVILLPFYTNRDQLEFENFESGIDRDKIFIINEIQNNQIIRTYRFNKLLNMKSSGLGIEYISLHKNNFSIDGDWGNSNKFYSKIYITYRYNNFYVDSLAIESNGLYQFQETIKFNNNSFELNNFDTKIIDSLHGVFSNESNRSR